MHTHTHTFKLVSCGVPETGSVEKPFEQCHPGFVFTWSSALLWELINVLQLNSIKKTVKTFNTEPHLMTLHNVCFFVFRVCCSFLACAYSFCLICEKLFTEWIWKKTSPELLHWNDRMMCISFVLQKHDKTDCFMMFNRSRKDRFTVSVNAGSHSWMLTNKVRKSLVE